MRVWSTSRARRALRLVMLFWVAATVAAPSALGHAAFLDSSPPPGARLEQTPRQIELGFTEPLNKRLTRVELVNLATGKRVGAELSSADARKVVVRPTGRLGQAAYRVDWHTVSTEDGHALEGAFSFGVRTQAADVEHRLEQSPLARGGWMRIAVRGLFYAALFFFAGGVFAAVLLARRAEPAAWLLVGDGGPADDRARRIWGLTLDAGALALGLSVATAILEGSDAAGALSVGGLSDFLLSNAAGLARIATVIAIGMALLLAKRLRLAAAAVLALAFLAISISGHANSAEPRAPSIATDWIHLIAAAVWLGGIAQIAAAWLPSVRGSDDDLGRRVMRTVLPRFGRVASPAFVVVAGTGLTNALVQLGHVGALWTTAYGRVLAVKIAIVGLIACASYWHAVRLRPRLLAANPHPPQRLQRRHWRVLGAEPLLAVGVVAAAALLVAFPLPPRQLASAEEAGDRPGIPACEPCPLAQARPNELAVAEQAGSSIAALWLRREDGGLKARLRVLDLNAKPVATSVQIDRSAVKSCGRGCWDFVPAVGSPVIALRVRDKGRWYSVTLPARWSGGGSRSARRILGRAERAMQALRAVREDQTVTSGPGSFARTVFRLRAPGRMAYRTDRGVESVVIGRRDWSRTPDSPWQKGRYGGGGPPFRTRSWFRWTSYAQAVRLLGTARAGGRRVAELALFDRGTPVWYRLRVDLGTVRVLGGRMISGGHFMNQRFFSINRPARIAPPVR